MNKNTNEPLWIKMYREQVLKPQQKERATEKLGRTEASRSGFYSSSSWITIRDLRRANNPLCQHCEAKGIIKTGRIIDHIIPVDEAPHLALDYNNTQHLCFKCNDIKTKADAKRKKEQAKLKVGAKLMEKFEAPEGGS